MRWWLSNRTLMIDYFAMQERGVPRSHYVAKDGEHVIETVTSGTTDKHSKHYFSRRFRERPSL